MGLVRPFLSVVCASLFMVLAPPMLRSQGTSARMVGTVSDPAGAAIPGAKVMARNVLTNLERFAETNTQGDYTLSSLPPGRYTVEVEFTGFQRYERKGIELVVNQIARIDVQLTIGGLTETITVEAGAPLVDSETAAVGQVIGESQIRELPLNGRNFVQLGQLVPGATQGPPGATTVRSRQGGHSLTINGQREDQNNWMLDGVDNNAQLFGMVVVVPSVESIREFKVQTSTYSAEFGRAAGAVVNVETKSGTNQFHGSVYEYFRNDNLDATEYFAPVSEETNRRIKPPLVFNQFGASLGGPVRNDSTFFFVNYEGRRTRRGSSAGSLVPTPEERQGDYSASPTIYDPLTYSAETRLREPFADNQIPAARIHPASAGIREFIPLPNSSDPARNFVTAAGATDDSDQVPVRVDQRLSDRQWVMGRFSYYNTDNVTNNAFPFDADLLQNRHRSFAAQHAFSVTPTMFNEFRIGGNWYHFGYLHETAGENYTEEFGLPSFAKGTLADGFPEMRIRGMARLGGNAAVPLDRKERTFQVTDSLSWIKGAHSIKLGGDARRYTSNNYQPQYGRGRYYFNGVFTPQVGSVYANGFADFLLGLPSQQRLRDASEFEGQQPRNWRWSAFVQDDWKVSPRLTLNLGLRFEYDGAWTEKSNHVGTFDVDGGEIVYAKDYVLPFPVPFPNRHGDSNNLQDRTTGWGPRIGLAWRPSASADFVVRSGYGVFWAARTAENLLAAASLPPFVLEDRVSSSSTVPELQFGETRLNDPSQLVPSILSSSVLAQGSGRNPYTQQWTFTIEKQIGADIGASIGYVGNHTIRLSRSYQGNSALPGPGSIQPRRRFPLFGSLNFLDSDAASSYHALQARLEKRASRGLNLLSTYTWSKALDDHGGSSETGGGIQDPYNRALTKGRASHDLRHRFTLAAVYQIPLASGASNRFVKALAQGWQLNAIVTLQSGFPFSALMGGDTVNAAAGSVYPNLIGSNHGNLDPGDRDINQWFDTSAFVPPAQYTFGTAGRNILDGPGTQILDLGLARVFRIHEGHQIQFRAEFFNSFNHPNFGFPGTTVGAGNFGVIRSASRPREVQLALRYAF